MTTLRQLPPAAAPKRRKLQPNSPDLGDSLGGGQPSCSYDPDLHAALSKRRSAAPADLDAILLGSGPRQHGSTRSHSTPPEAHGAQLGCAAKSARRRAAEALLAARFGPSQPALASGADTSAAPAARRSLHALAPSPAPPRPPQPPPPPCTGACCCRVAPAAAAAAAHSHHRALSGPLWSAAANLSAQAQTLSGSGGSGSAAGGGGGGEADISSAPTLASSDSDTGSDAPMRGAAWEPQAPPRRQREMLSAASRALQHPNGPSASRSPSPSHERDRLGGRRPTGYAASPPPLKRARLELSAAAATSLGLRAAAQGEAKAAEPAGAAVGAAVAAPAAAPGPGPAAAPPARAAKFTTTTVAACDPARGCQSHGNREAAAAEAPTPGGEREGSGLLSLLLGAEAGGAEAAGPEKAADAAASSLVWCRFPVKVPSLSWQAVFDDPPAAMQRLELARGYEKLVLPEGLVGYLVENPRHAADALKKLRDSMQDRLVAIDLEWRPQFAPGPPTPVALLQLSSATTAVLLRVSAMGWALPPPAREFLADPSVTLLGYGWDSADEAKCMATFGFGRAAFPRFLDLQEVATGLGYHGYGLSRLTGTVLGVQLHKAKSVSRSNWAAPRLTPHQLKYACLDVLAAGQLFRALRLWHSSPSPCAACRAPVGELLPLGPLRCAHPGCAKPAADLPRHAAHCASTGHAPAYGACPGCGRAHRLARKGQGRA